MPAGFVYRAMKLPAVLTQLREKRQQIAAVTDEYGGIIGLVSVEDVLEELVGEIWDEHDEVVEDIVKLPDGSLRVSGGASLEDLKEYLHIPDSYESVTVNGWVLEVLGHFPQPGDGFDFENVHVTVEKVARRRVEQIRVTPLVKEGGET